MEKKTKVKISMVTIPIIVILLIVGIVVLIISIRKMQKEEINNSSNEKQTQQTTVAENVSNTTDTSNKTNTSNTSSSKKNEKENTTSDKKSSKEDSLAASRIGDARDAIAMGLASIASHYYAGDFEDADSLQDTLTVENLENSMSEYNYEVSWNKGKTKATVRMQLKNDDTSPIYVAEIDDVFVIQSFEVEEEEDE